MNLRPLNIAPQVVKNVADKERSSVPNASVSVVVLNEVKIMKPSLVKNKRSITKGKCGKKRVRFTDSDPSPEVKASLCERFVRFFHILWKYTQTSVRNVLSKFYFIV